MSGAPSPGPADKAMRLGGIRLSALIESMDDEVWFADRQGKMILANPSARRHFRLSDGEIGVEDLAASLEVLRPDGTPRPMEEAPPLRALSGEAVIRQEEIIRIPQSGELRFRQVTSNPVREPSGEIVGAVSVVRDITEQKRAEAALRASLDFNWCLINGIQDGVSVLDTDGAHTEANPALCRMTGFAREELIGAKLPHPYWPPEERGRIAAAFDALREGKVQNFEFVFMRKSGERFPVIVSPSPIKNHNGATIGYVATVKDITERKRAEDELKERDRQITTLMGNLPGMAYRCRNDRDWTMEYISEGAAKLTGYAVEDLRNSTVISYAQVIHPDDREPVWEAVQKAVRARTTFELNYRIVTAGGGVKWVWEQGCGVFSDSGDLLALEGFITDISSKKIADDALLDRERELAASREHFRLLAENSSDMVVRKNRDGVIEWIAPSGAAMLGWLPEELVGHTFGEFVHPDDLDALRSLHATVDSGVAGQADLRMRVRVGGFRWLAVSLRPVLDADNRVVGRVASGRDIQSEALARETLRVQQARLRATLDCLLDPHVVLDPARPPGGGIADFIITDANPAACQFLGLPREDFLGKGLRQIFSPVFAGKLLEAARVTLESSAPLVLDNFAYNAPGSPAEQFLDIRAVKFNDSLSLSWRDVTGRHRAAQELDRRARTDDLTKLLNRKEVLERITKLSVQTARTGTKLAVLFCDFDRFKEINDIYGHAAGDEVLRVMAERIRGCLRTTDDLGARIGGDEMLVVLHGVHNLDNAVNVAEKLRVSAMEPIPITGGAVNTTLSIGVTLAVPGETTDALIARADAAMYKAKKTRRNRVVTMSAGKAGVG